MNVSRPRREIAPAFAGADCSALYNNLLRSSRILFWETMWAVTYGLRSNAPWRCSKPSGNESPILPSLMSHASPASASPRHAACSRPSKDTRRLLRDPVSRRYRMGRRVFEFGMVLGQGRGPVGASSISTMGRRSERLDIDTVVPEAPRVCTVTTFECPALGLGYPMKDTP